MVWMTQLMIAGAVLVFEYLYFSLQGKEDGHDLQEDLTLAVKKYETSGVHANVQKHINAAFQEHGEDVEILCPILVDIAKQNQMCKMLFPSH
ncbi:hypothetical protein EDC04DRAFT_239102 [Pisolithus marmoratus]|nr:hypothetical protein EDC04DRAFT_239102 [Pisolithus marmoratus]